MGNTCDLTGWAGDLLEALGDTTTTTGSVVTWLESNVGMFNLYAGTTYSLSGDCITPGFGPTESGIYGEMYYCNRLKKLSSSTIMAANESWTAIEFEEQGAVRRDSAVAITKMYGELHKDCEQRLDKIFGWYKRQENQCLPEQVLTDFRKGPRMKYKEYSATRSDLFSNWNRWVT